MPDLHDRFRPLDDVEVPDLWHDVEARLEAPESYTTPVPRRRAPILAAAAVLVVVVAGGLLFTSDDGENDTALDTGTSTSLPPSTALTPAEATSLLPPATGFVACRQDVLRAFDPVAKNVELGPPGAPALPPDTTQYVVRWDHEGVPVELRVPVTVVIDLVGERTDVVDVNGHEAIRWYSSAAPWVQVRVSKPTGSPCGTYEVTAYGPDQQRNADVATDVARGLLFDYPSPPSHCSPVVMDYEVTERTVNVSFLCGEATNPLVAYPREAPSGDDKLEFALNQLLRGPARDEAAGGAWTAFSVGWAAPQDGLTVEASVDGEGVAHVDFRRNGERWRPHNGFTSFQLASLVDPLYATVFSFPEVRELDRSNICWGEVGCAAGPLTRAEWEQQESRSAEAETD